LARPAAEEAVAIDQRVVADPGELGVAANTLSYVCFAMGDKSCALRTSEMAVQAMRKGKGWSPLYLAGALGLLVQVRKDNGDMAGARAALDEALAIAERQPKGEKDWAFIETDATTFFLAAGEYEVAQAHAKKALEMIASAYGTDSIQMGYGLPNMANLEMLLGKPDASLEDYKRAQEIFVRWYGTNHTRTAAMEGNYARALDFVGRYQEAIEMALQAHRAMRDYVGLAIRLMPERQALALSNSAAVSLDYALSVTAQHKDIEATRVYQELVRSRALVAEEMAQREAGLNRKRDPAVAALEKELETERKAVMDLQGAEAGPDTATSLVDATAKMEKTEQVLAERSVAFRSGERTRSSDLKDLRDNLPAGSVLVSYVAYSRNTPEPGHYSNKLTPAYTAFVMHRDSERIGVYDLGDGKRIAALVRGMRASADKEAHSGGLDSIRNEREYRDAALQLRKTIWDPLKEEIGQAKLVLVVADGVLNLVPFSALPEGSGYMVEHGPVVHMLTSERDLVPAGIAEKKSGLLAVGNPSFETASVEARPAALREAPVRCGDLAKLDFNPLPGSLEEVKDISVMWLRWEGREPQRLLIGQNATRAQFLEAAPQARILHVATHAFILDKSCGNGNPLLHSGLVFAGANRNRDGSILTAQQIASLDLSGVDWAVLSACNTGNGELQDGEGVLGLERSFRVAGVKSVVMTLWPVDDDATQRYMHVLYAERFGAHASTADAVWNAARKVLQERRAAGKSTHPWYWAGFVGAGGWQ
jgi:CHAT domain-containing protein